MMDVKIVITGDGSHTLAVPSIDEHYHSVHGAIAESRHIFIDAGLKQFTLSTSDIKILEIGFGTGLNAILTLQEITLGKICCEYTSIEMNPIDKEIYSCLNYPSLLGTPKEEFISLHECKWNEAERINDLFILHKIHASIHDLSFPEEIFDLVYFDAFGPDKQPDMWTEQVFTQIFASMKNGGILTTYSTKGDVKRILKKTGFVIEKLPGPEGKREMLRATRFSNAACTPKRSSA